MAEQDRGDQERDGQDDENQPSPLLLLLVEDAPAMALPRPVADPAPFEEIEDRAPLVDRNVGAR